MKRKNKVLGLLALFVMCIIVMPSIYAKEVTVNPSTESIGTVLSNADAGDTIILDGDGQYTGEKIIVDKDITIKGINGNRIYVANLFEINGATNVTLDNLILTGGGMITDQVDHNIIDVKSPATINLNNVIVSYGTRASTGGGFKADVKDIYLEAGSDGTNLTITNSIIDGLYSSLIVESSNNTINIDNSNLGGNVAIRLKDGTGNKLYVKNDSRISGRSSLVANSEEAISIIGQENLTLEVTDSELHGLAVADKIYGEDGSLLPNKKEIPAHIISFDEKASNNVNISIKGTSRIVDDDQKGESNVINFGEYITPQSNVNVLIEGGVSISPDTVNEKYNVSENYVVVGIKDKDGNCKIKPYAKNTQVPESELPKNNVVGYKLDRLTYKSVSYEEEQEYVSTMNITENTDIISHYTKLLDIKIDGTDETFYIDKGATLANLRELSNANTALENLKNPSDPKKLFKNYVVSYTDDDEMEKADVVAYDEDTYVFQKDSTISADYENMVKVTLKVGDEERVTAYIESGKTLGDLSEEDIARFNEATTSDTKRLKEYAEIIDGEYVTVAEDTPITEDITIVAVFEVDVTIGVDKYVIDEGKTLETIADQIEKYKTADKKDFKNFVKDTDESVVEETMPIHEHITLKPTYTVKVTFEGAEYTIDEGQSLSELAEDEVAVQNALLEMKNREDKNFKTFVDEEGTDVGEYDGIKKHSTLTPTYTVTVTVGEETFELDENATLSSLTPEELEKLNALKTDRFARFADEEGNTVDENTKITKNTTLTVKNYIKVNIDDTDYNLEEGRPLREVEEAGLETINRLKSLDYKRFKEFRNEDDEVVEDYVPLYEDVVLTAYYTVQVSIEGGEKYNLDEGQTLADLPNSAELLSQYTQNERFSRFTDETGNTIEQDTPIRRHTNIVARMIAKVTISGSVYDVEISETYSKLPAEALAKLEALKTDRFLRFVDSDGNTVDLDTSVVEKDTTLSAKYSVRITIGKYVFNLENGQTLNDLPEEDIEKLKKLESECEEYERFAGFTLQGQDDIIDMETYTFETDTVLEAKYEVRKGDVNMDGYINSTDAADVLDAFKEGNPNETMMLLGDMNDDKNLNSDDAALILDLFKTNNEGEEEV